VFMLNTSIAITAMPMTLRFIAAANLEMWDAENYHALLYFRS